MEEAAVFAPCTQCNKPAVSTIGGSPLCVACYHQFTVAQTLGFRLAAIGINHATAEMDAMTGMLSPRIQVPEIPKGPVILNNIKVDNSTVGAINTGNVRTIDVSITVLKQAGFEEVSNVLKTLAEVIANDQAASADHRNQLLDQIAFLSQQAVTAMPDRHPGVIKATLAHLAQAAPTIAALATIWQAAEPILRTFFGP